MSMNDNARLYQQTLSYNENDAPYVCLSLPWWIKTRHPTYYPRHRCDIEPIICGERVFKRIARDIKKARHTVDIITWGFDPGMVLVRGAAGQSGQRYGDLIKEVASRADDRVKVRLVVWHDDPLSQKQMKNIPGVYGAHFAAVGCGTSGYYSTDHQEYNAAWFAQVCAGEMKNVEFKVRNVPSDTVDAALKGEKDIGGPKAGLAKLYPTHHQKMILIDYEEPAAAIGYVMGHNSVTDFWDTAQHLHKDPRRETFYAEDPAKAWDQGESLSPGGAGGAVYGQPTEAQLAAKDKAMREYLARISRVAKPYQDVSCRLLGPVLYDLNHNFCQAWQEAARPAGIFVDAITTLVHTIPVGKWLDVNLKRAAAAAQANAGIDFIEQRKKVTPGALGFPEGRHSVQLMRTQPMHGEKAIKECYANMMRQTHHYIFLQNQYVQYEAWAEHLKECAQRLRAANYDAQLYVFIQTSTPESDGMDEPTYSVAGAIGQSPSMVVEHDAAVNRARKGKGPQPVSVDEMAKQGINVVLASLWTCAQKPAGEPFRADDYEEIYIHAKVAIADDAAFTIGSANLNLRSMCFDSELNVLSDAHDVAHKLRTELFDQSTGGMGPPQFGDMVETYKNWGVLMRNNVRRKEKGEPLKHQLMAFHVDRKPGRPVV